MDSGKFDRLARFMAVAPSRRSVLRGLVATAFGGVVVGQSARVEAKVGDSCRNGKCGENERCNNNDVCVCKNDDGIRQCGRECVDIRNDDDNCGGCGKECPNRKECRRGKCRRRREDGDDGGGNCVNPGFCGEGQPPCCAGFACTSGQPEDGLGGCTPVGG